MTPKSISDVHDHEFRTAEQDGHDLKSRRSGKTSLFKSRLTLAQKGAAPV